MGKAQALVEQAASSADNITLAKSNAEKTLRLLCKQLGWDVEIRWRARNAGGVTTHKRITRTLIGQRVIRERVIDAFIC